MTDDTIALLTDEQLRDCARSVHAASALSPVWPLAKDYAREAVRLYIEGRVGAEPEAWLTEWVVDDKTWVDVDASELRAIAKAKYYGAKITPMVRAAPTTPPDAQAVARAMPWIKPSENT